MPRRYRELASWFHLFTAPEEYLEEAHDIDRRLRAAIDGPCVTMLELGSGGGNNASHLRVAGFTLTLVDLSPEMLAQSRTINPDCEHVVGDMRTVRLGRQFDAVLIHDAIMYMLDEGELRRALETAFVHCRPGGAALLLPDCVRETFRPETSHGGHDGADGRELRYLEWCWDPDPDDTTAEIAFSYLLREADGVVRGEHDHDRFGLFPRATWLRLLGEVGFMAERSRDAWDRDVFTARRPRAAAS